MLPITDTYRRHSAYSAYSHLAFDKERLANSGTATVPLYLVFVLPFSHLKLYTKYIYVYTVTHGGTQWRSWLRNCATSRKVAGSIPDGVVRSMAFGVDSASNRNEYQEFFGGVKDGRCVGLTTLPPSFADCLEIWEPQTPGTLRDCPGM